MKKKSKCKSKCKSKKQFIVNFDVYQKFSNSLDVEAYSEEEAINIVKEMVSEIKINFAYTPGYLQDNKRISPYWYPTGSISLDDSSFSIE